MGALPLINCSTVLSTPQRDRELMNVFDNHTRGSSEQRRCSIVIARIPTPLPWFRNPSAEIAALIVTALVIDSLARGVKG